jgi:prepilin-type processing-associated H-X9-DG protein
MAFAKLGTPLTVPPGGAGWPHEVNAAGALVWFNYLTDPQALYCTDQKKHENDLDLPKNQHRFGELLSQQMSKHRSSAGYSHFMYRMGTDGRTVDDGYEANDDFDDWTRENPLDGRHPVSSQELAARHNDNGYTPILWACARSNGGTRAWAHDNRGVNAGMFDGSARWVDLDEIHELVEQRPPGGGAPIKNNVYLGNRFRQAPLQNHTSIHVGSSMQIVVHLTRMELTAP